jgi:hypothetical protein
MLAMAEYAYNNSKHASTKISPFYANYRFEPRSNWPAEIQFRNPTSELYGHYMNSVHKNLRERLKASVEAMQKNYNKKRKIMEPLKKREFVMLNVTGVLNPNKSQIIFIESSTTAYLFALSLLVLSQDSTS